MFLKNKMLFKLNHICCCCEERDRTSDHRGGYEPSGSAFKLIKNHKNFMPAAVFTNFYLLLKTGK